MKSIISRLKEYPILFFFVKFSVFGLIIFLIDFSVGKTLKHFYFRQKSGFQYRTTYSIGSTKAEVLIFGSSRANHHYYPEVFEDSLKMSYYNCGRDGCSILYHYSVLKSVLKRHQPKVVVLDLVMFEFIKNTESYDRLSALFPYYDDHSEIRPIIHLKGEYEKYKFFSKIYPYNSSIFSIAVGNLESNKKRTEDRKGYLPNPYNWGRPITPGNLPIQYELDTNKIRCFENFLKDCLNKKIQIFVFVSPKYVVMPGQDTSLALGKQIAEKLGVKLYDYTEDKTFKSTVEWFGDMNHLNDKGAQVYSKIVVEKILQNFKF